MKISYTKITLAVLIMASFLVPVFTSAQTADLGEILQTSDYFLVANQQSPSDIALRKLGSPMVLLTVLSTFIILLVITAYFATVGFIVYTLL